MIQQYFSPIFKSENFHCAHCQVYAHQHWFPLNYHWGNWQHSDADICSCSHCKRKSYWVNEVMVFPAVTSIEPPHTDLPSDCHQDYIEASEIFSRSPRASAALLRLSIQKLMPHLGERGENINDDIKSLVSKGLPLLVQQALDVCRVVGNNAVHPGTINLNDTPDIASALFRMINFIVQERITRPKEIQELYSQLPESSRNAIDRRDNPTP